MVRALVLTMVLAVPSTAVSAAVTANTAPEHRGACHVAVAAMESAYNLPPQLLSAVALAESGRWNAEDQESFAWPWTVTASGESHYLPDKAAAVRAVRDLQARGIRNIDVGCMQINLMHIADAFPSLEDAFDPRLNADYAASFLRQLYQEVRGWSLAVGY